MYRYVLSYPFGAGLVGKEGEDPAPGTNIQHNLACNTVRQSLPYRITVPADSVGAAPQNGLSLFLRGFCSYALK